jgi:predicted aspartyl protease
MAHLSGSFDGDGNPIIEIWVYGRNRQSKQKFDAIIDTGFTGFLFLPLDKAAILEMAPRGTTTVMLANQSTCPCLTAMGTIILDDREADGLVLLQRNSTEVLVGVDFLRRFERALVIAKNFVLLIDEREARRI